MTPIKPPAELLQVGIKMVLAQMVVRTNHAALEQRKRAFDGFGGEFALL
jgi:hypothetical protein